MFFTYTVRERLKHEWKSEGAWRITGMRQLDERLPFSFPEAKHGTRAEVAITDIAGRALIRSGGQLFPDEASARSRAAVKARCRQAGREAVTVGAGGRGRGAIRGGRRGEKISLTGPARRSGAGRSR